MQLFIINAPAAKRLKRVEMRFTFAANAVRPRRTPADITPHANNVMIGRSRSGAITTLINMAKATVALL